MSFRILGIVLLVSMSVGGNIRARAAEVPVPAKPEDGPISLTVGHGHQYLWNQKQIFALHGTTFIKVGTCQEVCVAGDVRADGRLVILDGRQLMAYGDGMPSRLVGSIPENLRVRGIVVSGNTVIAFGSARGAKMCSGDDESLRDECDENGTERLPAILEYENGRWAEAAIRTHGRGEVRSINLAENSGIALTSGRVLRSLDDGRSWNDIQVQQVCAGWVGDCEWRAAAASGNKFWIVGNDGMIATSRDQGISWRSSRVGSEDLCQVLSGMGTLIVKTCNGRVLIPGRRVHRSPEHARDIGLLDTTLWVLTMDSRAVISVPLAGLGARR